MQGTLFLNVQNLFNQQPTPAASGGPQGRPGNFGGYAPGDDPIGRYYSVGVRYKL
jgi:iron complex outermembrane recepter protein